MVTEKQLIANRENGVLGGVKTAAGKAKVRLNAVTHGLLSREVLLSGESKKELRRLRDNLMSQYEPVGEMETVLVDMIVSCIWRSKRLLKVENYYLTRKMAMVSSFDQKGIQAWNNLMRYESHIDRKLFKAMRDLEWRQSLRNGKNVLPPITIEVDQPVPD